MKKPAFAAIVFLLALSSYLFFFQLGNMALTDPDEAFYAQTAKEMLERGEWLTPYLYGKPQFEKPILFYWLLELSCKAFGVNEFAMRFPSAVFGFLGLAAVYLLGGMLFTRRVGLFASLILATNVEYIILSRACVTDMALGTFVLWGILFFLRAHRAGRPPFYILSAAAFALAVLTKGPIGVMLPAMVIVPYLVAVKDTRFFKDIKFLAISMIVFLGIALPWYVIAYKLHGKEFIDVFFGFHNITRFMEPEHKVGSQWYYYIPIVLGGFFPWSVFLPIGLWRLLKKAYGKDAAERGNPIFLLLWFFVIFIFFSASSTKLPTYIFPVFGSIALAVALAWDDFLKEKAPKAAGKTFSFSYYSLIVIVLLGAVGLYLFIAYDYPTMIAAAVVPGIFLVFGHLLSLTAFVRKRYKEAFFFIVYSVPLFLYPLSKLTLPEIERYEASKAMAEKILSLGKSDERIGAEHDYLSGLAFYTGRPVEDLDRHHNLVRFLSSDTRVWCLLKEKNHRQLYELDTKPFLIKPSYMVYKFGKKCIVTNKVPSDGKYLIKRERSR